MQITKEILEKQLNVVKTNMDGYMAGYLAALSYINNILEAKEPEVAKQSEPAVV